MKMSKKSKIVIYILLGLVAIYFLAPFIYMLFSAFKTEGEAIAYPPKLLPAEWHFENFINAWKSQPFGTYLWNSILVTVLTTVGQVLSCSLVAYGFARFNFKGKNILFVLIERTPADPHAICRLLHGDTTTGFDQALCLHYLAEHFRHCLFL